MKEISRRITNYFCKYEEISLYSEEVQFAIYQILWGISTFFIALIGVYIFSGNIQSGIVFSIFFLPLRWAASVLVLQCVCLLYLHIIIMQA